MPQGWEQTPYPDHAVLVVRPGGRGAAFVYLASAAGRTLDQIEPSYERERSRLPGYKQIRVDGVMIDGQRAYRNLVSYTSNGEEILNQFVFFLADEVAHTIGASAYPADFGQLAPVFDGIAGAYTVGSARR